MGEEELDYLLGDICLDYGAELAVNEDDKIGIICPMAPALEMEMDIPESSSKGKVIGRQIRLDGGVQQVVVVCVVPGAEQLFYQVMEVAPRDVPQPTDDEMQRKRDAYEWDYLVGEMWKKRQAYSLDDADRVLHEDLFGEDEPLVKDEAYHMKMEKAIFMHFNKNVDSCQEGLVTSNPDGTPKPEYDYSEVGGGKEWEKRKEKEWEQNPNEHVRQQANTGPKRKETTK